jgi:CheY-like chemotaxis protein
MAIEHSSSRDSRDERTPVGGTRILVVENEALLSEELKEHLTRMGYTPTVAHTGEAAVDAAERFQPDLVLMDIRLPGKVDGIEAAATIRERFGAPIIYLTAHSDSATIERAQGTAPSGYLLKPLRDGELRAGISTALHSREVEKDLIRRNVALAHEVALLQKANRELDIFATSPAPDPSGPLGPVRTTLDRLPDYGPLSPVQLEPREHGQGSVNPRAALVDASLSRPRLEERER